MGRITLYMKDDCPYCNDVTAAINRAWSVALITLQSGTLAPDVKPLKTCYQQVHEHAPALEPPAPWKPVTVVKLNVLTDARYAAQSRKLAGVHTVPQVFLNSAHIGGAVDVLAAEKTGILASLLVDLARAPDVDFPPAPDAAMVKVTEEIAFASQPSAGQLKGIGRFGFSTVVSLRHRDEVGILADTGEILSSQGVSYFDCGPATLPPVTGARSKEVITLPCSGLSFQQQPHLAEALDTLSFPKLTLSDAVPTDPDVTMTTLPVKTEVKCSGQTCVKPMPQTVSRCSGSTCSPCVSPALSDDSSRCSGSPRSPRFRSSFDSTGSTGAVPTTTTTSNDPVQVNDAWTVDWATVAVETVKAARKPVLVMDGEGMSACAITLLYVAVKHRATLEQVLKWGWDLGYDLRAHTAMYTVLETVLARRQSPSLKPTALPSETGSTPSTMSNTDVETK